MELSNYFRAAEPIILIFAHTALLHSQLTLFIPNILSCTPLTTVLSNSSCSFRSTSYALFFFTSPSFISICPSTSFNKIWFFTLIQLLCNKCVETYLFFYAPFHCVFNSHRSASPADGKLGFSRFIRQKLQGALGLEWKVYYSLCATTYATTYNASSNFSTAQPVMWNNTPLPHLLHVEMPHFGWHSNVMDSRSNRPLNT